MKIGKYDVMVSPNNYPGTLWGGYAPVHHVVYWQHTGVTPGPGEVIHHKDGNGHNNEFLNLLLLTTSEHSRLHAKQRGGAPHVTLVCAQCGEEFECLVRHVRRKRKLGQERFFCSYSCGTKYQHGSRPEYITLNCAYCGIEFNRKASWVRDRRKRQKQTAFFCSRSCSGKYYGPLAHR